MKRIQRVGIDIDGTVANFMAGAIPLFAEAYGIEPINALAEKAYGIEAVFGLDENTRPKGMKKHLYDELHLFSKLPMLEVDSYKLTHQIRDLGAKIYFITARPGRRVIMDDTIGWLEDNNFVFDDIFFTDQKAILCEAMHISVMIEDEIGQLIDLIKNHTNVVVPKTNWNEDLAQKIDELIDPQLRGRPGKWVYAENRKEAFYAVKEYLL